MCKTIKNCFYDKLTFQKMLEAHDRASKGKRLKPEIVAFEIDLETNLIRIIKDIKSNKYQFGNYREFVVYEPKERTIKSLPYRDRIVHQWYIEEFIKPYFFKRFINDTYACLDYRGTHKAMKKVQYYMRIMKRRYNDYYVLKCDIKKYFYSIDKSILLNILKKHISDKQIISFSEVILNDGSLVGIPIGNYTSQFFANIYLNELDSFIKYHLQVKYYVRYMDDFIILVETKEEAKVLLERIEKFLNENLNLELNTKSRYYPNKYGINFCGYRIFETHVLLRNRFKKHVSESIRLWEYLASHNKLNIPKMEQSWRSLKGHASHSNSFNYVRKYQYKFDLICATKNEKEKRA